MKRSKFVQQVMENIDNNKLLLEMVNEFPDVFLNENMYDIPSDSAFRQFETPAQKADRETDERIKQRQNERMKQEKIKANEEQGRQRNKDAIQAVMQQKEEQRKHMMYGGAAAAGGLALLGLYKLYKNWKAKRDAARTPQEAAAAEQGMQQAKTKIAQAKARG